MNQQAEDAEYAEYERNKAEENAKELDAYKKAVEMCISHGHLKKEKFDKAYKFVQEFAK